MNNSAKASPVVYVESSGTSTHTTDCVLIPVDLAIVKGLALAKPVTEPERVSLLKARQRINFEKLEAKYPLPNFNNSAMDGYALNTKNLTGDGPYRLQISGRIAAGDAAGEQSNQPAKDAIRILTGAQVPKAYNAVIMQEKCTIEDGYVNFEQCPPVDNNIRYAGNDCTVGESIIEPSILIQPHHIALLAAQGQADVLVFRKVRVAIFSTGSELRQPGEELLDGQIFNSNRYTLAIQLDLPFIDVIDLGTIPDDPELLKQALNQACEMADVVITTGGVSVGDEDHMPRLVGELGGTLHVMKVAIKPGKPVTIGTIGDTIYVGLPGNPVAAFINQILIARPIIEKIAGISNPRSKTQVAQAGFTRTSNISRQEYILARVIDQTADGLPVVETISNSGSASLVPLSKSDGFVVIPPGETEIKKGETMQYLPH